MAPVIEHRKQILAQFMDRYWNYYRELNSFRLMPESEEAQHLNALFDDIFSTKTDYEALNTRIEKTRRNKGMLLQVLDHPEILLHNNPAELAVRRRVRKRDVSFGPRSNEGLKAWDTLMTLAETAGKQSISFLQYLIDYHTRRPDAASLAELIRQAATQLNLSASWETTYYKAYLHLGTRPDRMLLTGERLQFQQLLLGGSRLPGRRYPELLRRYPFWNIGNLCFRVLMAFGICSVDIFLPVRVACAKTTVCVDALSLISGRFQMNRNLRPRARIRSITCGEATRSRTTFLVRAILCRVYPAAVTPCGATAAAVSRVGP